MRNLDVGLWYIEALSWYKGIGISFYYRLLGNNIGSKLEVDRSKVFSIHLSFDFGSCNLFKVMLYKVLFNWGFVINLIASVLNLSGSRFLTPVCLVLPHLLSVVLGFDAWVPLYIRLGSLVRCDVLILRAPNIEIGLSNAGHIQLDPVGTFISKSRWICCLIMELRVKVGPNRKILLAWHFPDIFHCLLHAWRISCRRHHTELLLSRWNRFEFYMKNG